MGRRLTLYGRPGCHLCDDARIELRRLGQELSFDWNEVNIETDDQLHKRFLEKIPVLVDGDEVIAELVWDFSELREHFARPSRAE